MWRTILLLRQPAHRVVLQKNLRRYSRRRIDNTGLEGRVPVWVQSPRQASNQVGRGSTACRDVVLIADDIVPSVQYFEFNRFNGS